MTEIDITVARLKGEEEFMGFLYDDATDRQVKAPVGKATIGYGCNVQAGWSEPFALKVLRLQVEDVAAQIQNYPWYSSCNPERRSVFLDIGFNDGVHGLLGFPNMLADVLHGNWVGAEAQCEVKNPKLQARYSSLSKILLTGNLA